MALNGFMLGMGAASPSTGQDLDSGGSIHLVLLEERAPILFCVAPLL